MRRRLGGPVFFTGMFNGLASALKPGAEGGLAWLPEVAALHRYSGRARTIMKLPVI